jgi:S-DNA-T family DNA segregation ATPase FtsK/SpoIIIE
VLDDPSVSRTHLLVDIAPTSEVTVTDAGTKNGSYIDGAQLMVPVRVDAQTVVETGRSLLSFVPYIAPSDPLKTVRGEVPFNRPRRLIAPVPDETLKLPVPEEAPGRRRLPISTALLPLALGGAMAYVLKNPTMLLFSAMSPVMAAASLFEDRRTGRKASKRRIKEFYGTLAEVEATCRRLVSEEHERLRAIAPDASELVRRAVSHDSTLWERRSSHRDFLELRVGWGDRASAVRVDFGTGHNDVLREQAAAQLEAFRRLTAVPISVSLAATGVIGISGDAETVAALGRWLLVQTAVLHSPRDVIVAAAVPGQLREEYAWLGWLPHVHPIESPLSGMHVVAGNPSGRALLEELNALLTDRKQAGQDYRNTNERPAAPTIVVLLHEDVELPRGTVASLLADGPDHGIVVIWLGSVKRDLPGECRAIVELDVVSGTVELTYPDTGEASGGHSIEGVSVAVAREVALALAPVRDVSAREQHEIPKRVPLLDFLDLTSHPIDRIVGLWEGDDQRLAAPLGMTADGPFTISLREHGPHGLIGGTTRSGKSELLLSLIIALATYHPPSRLTFLIVDYKAGLDLEPCTALPHTVGFVTDLSGNLVQRALVSLAAELRRRERLLKAAGAKNVLDLRSKVPDQAIPSLLILVDELAALKDEHPEFIDDLIDIAQRGAAMGVHLILATQQPKGVITDKIRANTNLRIALRMQEVDDSIDVIKTKDALRKGLPQGRAFAVTGPGQLIEFQSAFSSGHSEEGLAPRRLLVSELGFGGIVNKAGHEAPATTGRKDSQRAIDAIIAANDRLAIPSPRRPWLPALPQHLDLAELASTPAKEGLVGTIGLVDDPTEQRQLVEQFVPADQGHLLVYGGGGAGKTTLLRTIAVSLALNSSPADLNIYCLDFASRGLQPLGELPHCGAVIGGDDPERVVRLLTMIRREMERRKSIFAEVGVGSAAEYRRARPEQALPAILLIVDGYGGFVSGMRDVDLGAPIDWLVQVSADGRSVGVHLAASADRRSAVTNAVAANVSQRIVLRMSDEDEYIYLGIDRATYGGASLPPGRGFTNRGLELQCAVVGVESAGDAQGKAIRVIAADLKSRYPAVSVPGIQLLPAPVSRDTMPSPTGRFAAFIGLSDSALAPVPIGLDEDHLVVIGRSGSGKTTALATVVKSLLSGQAALEAHLLAPRKQSPLAALVDWTSSAAGLALCEASILALVQRLGSNDVDEDIVIVVDDAEDLTEGDAADGLAAILRSSRESSIRVVAAVDSQAAQRAFGWLKEVMKPRYGILLDPEPVSDSGLLGGVRLPRQEKRNPVGRGYLVRRGDVGLIQVAGPARGDPC